MALCKLSPPVALWAIFCLLSSAWGAPDRIAVETKHRILDRIGDILETKAFSKGVDFDAWPRILESHREAIYDAATIREFEKSIDRALGEFGISHLYITPPPVLENDVERPIFKLGISGPNVVNGIRVTRVTRGSPAEEMGLRKKDTIIAIDDVAPARHENLFGKNGESLTIEWLRDGKLHHGVIHCRPYQSFDPPWIEWPQDDVAVIHIQSFAKGEYSFAKVNRLFKEARNANAILIDLRDNYGGLLRNALHLAGKVMPGKATFALHAKKAHYLKSGYDSKTNDKSALDSLKRYSKTLKPAFALRRYKGKVAILVDSYSASAADIFPASIAETDRGIVVGSKTRGALIGARDIRLPQGFRLAYPFVEVLTPHGNRLEGRGVVPDIELDWQETIDDETIYRRAIQALFPN